MTPVLALFKLLFIDKIATMKRNHTWCTLVKMYKMFREKREEKKYIFFGHTLGFDIKYLHKWFVGKYRYRLVFT